MDDKQKIKKKVEDYYLRYGPMVLRRCRVFFSDEDEALDAMQDVFIKLILYKKRLNGPYLSNFLFKIATNVCLNKIRCRQNQQTLDEMDLISKIAFYDDGEEKFILDSFLDHIFKREKRSTRDIAVMHFVEGLTLREVAQEVGLSVAGVRKRLRKLKERVNAMEVLNEN